MTDETWEQLDAARELAALFDERAVTAAWLDAQEFPPLEWTVDGILPEGMGLLVAPPKAGKSWMVANIALACAAGGSALGKIPVKKRPVLYLALEDGHRRLQSRFRTLMAGQPLPEGLEVVTRASSTEALDIVDESYADTNTTPHASSSTPTEKSSRPRHPTKIPTRPTIVSAAH